MHRVIYLPVQSGRSPDYSGTWSFEAIVQRQVNGTWTDVITPLAPW
jgi:hypothetical protein